jgi:two-component SAPR family response regulator
LWTLAAGLERVASACHANDAAALGSLVEHVSSLYKGEFLAGETQTPWGRGARERIKLRFVQQLGSAANVMMVSGRPSDACALYHRALEIDPVAEVLHLGLMHSYQRMGSTAEALSAYERCRAVMRKHMGTKPSVRIEALARQLRAT